jgi:hypothetical protein
MLLGLLVSQLFLGMYLSLSRREDKTLARYRCSMFVGFMPNMAILTQGALLRFVGNRKWHKNWKMN